MNYLIKAAFRSKANYWAAWALEAAAAPFAPPRHWLTPGDAAPWRRGILLGADHLGDILYRTGSLPVLARAAPGCSWTWACPAPVAALLQNNPHITETLELPASGLSSMVRALREGRFDVAVCYDTVSYHRFLTAARLAGIPARVGYVHKGFSFLVTHAVSCPYPRPYPLYFRDLAATAAGEEPSGDGRPLIYPSEKDGEEAAAFFRERRLDGHRRLLACSLFTRQPRGRYPSSLFAETLRSVQRATGTHIVLIGSGAERERLSAFAAEEGIAADVAAGELNVRALCCLLRRCHAAFTSDAGIRHLSNAAGIPVIFPRNLFFHRIEAGTYCAGEIDVAPERELVTTAEEGAEPPSFDTARAIAALEKIISSC